MRIRIIFRNTVDRHGQKNTDHGRIDGAQIQAFKPQAHPRRIGLPGKTQVEEPHSDKSDNRNGGRKNEPGVDRFHGIAHFVFGAHRISTDNRADHADRTHKQRENDALMPVRRVTQDHGGHNRDFIRFENIGRHPGAIPDVIAHVVGNCCGIARIIFRDIFFDFSDKVGTHIRSLRKDTTAHAHKKRQQGTAESKTQQNFVSLFSVDHEN